jgi:hypothetical protein
MMRRTLGDVKYKLDLKTLAQRRCNGTQSLARATRADQCNRIDSRHVESVGLSTTTSKRPGGNVA